MYNNDHSVADLRISNRGGSYGAVEFLGSRDCFDVPSHTPYDIVGRVENKLHIVNIICWLRLKYTHIKQSKFTKTLKKKISRAPSALVLDQHLLCQHAFLDTVRLDASTRKGCKSLRLFNHFTNIPPQCISSRGKHTNFTIFF